MAGAAMALGVGIGAIVSFLTIQETSACVERKEQMKNRKNKFLALGLGVVLGLTVYFLLMLPVRI